jgi:hypothetical protein
LEEPLGGVGVALGSVGGAPWRLNGSNAGRAGENDYITPTSMQDSITFHCAKLTKFLTQRYTFSDMFYKDAPYGSPAGRPGTGGRNLSPVFPPPAAPDDP